MDYNKQLQTSKKTKWTNKCLYIIDHHTWSWTFESNMEYLASWEKEVSCHYVIWENWEIWKIWEDTDILWHCWTSEWNWLTYMNKYAIWIEHVWPPFTDLQIESSNKLKLYLCEKYNIPKENIIRHKDIAPDRKVDIDDSFWNTKFESYRSYIDSIFTNNNKMTAYTELKDKLLSENNLTPIFNSYVWDKTLTEQEIKELIEIAFARFALRLLGKNK